MCKANHKDVSEDVVGEMKGSSLCTRSSSKGHACLVPRCDFHSTARLALVPRADVSRIIAAPRPVNNTSLRLSTLLPTVSLHVPCTKKIPSLLNTPV